MSVVCCNKGGGVCCQDVFPDTRWKPAGGGGSQSLGGEFGGPWGALGVVRIIWLTNWCNIEGCREVFII